LGNLRDYLGKSNCCARSMCNFEFYHSRGVSYVVESNHRNEPNLAN